MRKCGNISLYMRRPLVIYDFATAPFWISSYMRKIWFSFYQCRGIPIARRLGTCWRRCCWMRRTAFSSRGPSQLFFKSSMLCSVTSWVVFHSIFCFTSFSGQLVPWLCHSHTETVSSHLCPCEPRFSGSAACLVLAPVVLTTECTEW